MSTFIIMSRYILIFLIGSICDSYITIIYSQYIREYILFKFQRGFCETRIINQTLSLFFVGSKPLVFKPGMPFDAQIAVRYHDQVNNTFTVLE